MNKKLNISQQLRQLGLQTDEAKIYVELLKVPSTHSQLSYVTGINRTKVYRLITDLERRSLVSRRTDDRGTFLVATDPATLEIEIVSQEERIKRQRSLLTQLLPTLEALQSQDSHLFTVNTYDGIEGLKQMCWHELKTQDELLSLGGQTIEDLIFDKRWAEKHRKLNAEASYAVREIINGDIDQPTFTNNEDFMQLYQCRQLPSSFAYFSEQTIIYNDTVSVYHWRENKKVGVEIVSRSYADMMRKLFENLWQLAK